MQICLNCTEEFYQGDTCPTCGSKDIITERAEKEVYMKTKPTKKFKCKKCGYTTLTEEKITCCPKCKWNVRVVGQLGVDTKAHEGALNSPSGKTISILGSGILNDYPNENRQLFDEITKKGLIISEYLPFEHVNRFRLLSRNRLTSALSNASVIVASKKIGGAMHQINIAIKHGKKVFCPSPDLKLEPSEGIKFLLETQETVKSVNSFDDFKNELENFNSENQVTLINY